MAAKGRPSRQSIAPKLSLSPSAVMKGRNRNKAGKALYWKVEPPTISSHLENKTWHELQLELARLNQTENSEFFDRLGRGIIPAPITIPEKALDFVLSRYVQYCMIAKQLDICYHYLVHPQKRMMLKACLLAVFTRILELKNELVQIDQREYQFLEEIIETYGCTQADVELTVPLFIREETMDILKERERFLSSVISTENSRRPSKSEKPMTRQEAILLIQRQTRFYMANKKVELAHQVLRPLSEEDSNKIMRRVVNKWRVYTTRKEVLALKTEYERLLEIIPNDETLSTKRIMSDYTLSKRNRARAKANEEEYDLDKTRIENELFGSEGPFLAWSLHYTIKQWLLEVRDVIGNFSTFPSVEEGGSTAIFADKDINDVADDLSANMATGKFVFPPTEKKKKPKKEKKIAKKNPWGAEGFEYVIDETDCMREMKDKTLQYTDYWFYKDDSANLKQTHDRDLLQEELKLVVSDEIRTQVDELIRQELEKLMYAIDRIAPKEPKASKKKSKEKGKKGGKKKGKGDLTADRTVEELFRELLAQGIIRRCPVVSLDSFICEYSYSGGALDRALRDPMPSLADVKRMVMEFAVLPLSCQTLHQQASLTRKLLICGVRGTGKKLLVQAICNEVGATFFDLTPSNLEGKYDSKEGKKMLMHLIIKMGKALEPAVFWIGQCEKMFLKKKDKEDTANPGQWVKGLQKTLKKGIKNGDRMMLIGTSSLPSLTKPKKFNKFFDRIIIVPYPDYPSRYLAWKHFITLNLKEPLSPRFKLSSLTKVTSGYTIAAIKNTCEEVLTEKRKSILKYNPLRAYDFTNDISRHDPIFQEEHDEFLAWYNGTPLAKQRQKRVHQEEAEEAEKK